MFTGIVQAVATVESFDGATLCLHLEGPVDTGTIEIGESISVSGCCLTVVKANDFLTFELSPETLARTSLGSLRRGQKVNLERAMRADGRFGGHIVQGHVDATGKVTSTIHEGNSYVVRLKVPEAGARYLIDKGSITVDGISLTVVRPVETEFETWIIPHTWTHTSLSERKSGDIVNIEYDILARYLERLNSVDSLTSS